MKISIYYPSQEIVAKDLLFCEYTDHQFIHQCCNPDIDLIYSCSTSVLPEAYAAKEYFKKPLVCWCWDIPFNWLNWDLPDHGFFANRHRDMNNAKTIDLLGKCDLVISASKWTQSILKNYGIPSKQIYFYIDTKGLDSVKQPLKKEQIIQISRYFYNKKFEHSILASEGYDLCLVGIGLNSPYGHQLRSMAHNRVVFNDGISRQQTIEEIKKSTVLVSPSVFEGWGITPIEALYCEVPVLLSDLEVFREVYGDNVLYHKQNDPEDMKEKLKKLMSDKILQKKIVKACQPLISEFTPEKFAKRWEKCLI